MSGSEYNFLSRLLHRIALQSTIIPEVSFDIENTFVNKKGAEPSDSPVFITGLARCGTTILMQYLYETEAFRSLTYQDMPFVLMPNVWKKLSFRKTATTMHERAHQDGIMISFESPEAFEEVFWRVFCGNEYITRECLKTHEADFEILQKFRDYVYNVIISADIPSQSRYLSKNNNNILRLPTLFSSFPNATVIVPFREPLQHALSLLNQHKHFCVLQENNNFSLQYMTWLGHYEFGLNQKPFCFGIDLPLHDYPKSELNFWLLSWKNYYKYVLEYSNEKILLFSYEEFCETPESVMNALYSKIGIENQSVSKVPFKPTDKGISGFDQDILKECREIYDELELKFQSWYIVKERS